jgi:hypothetical protein
VRIYGKRQQQQQQEQGLEKMDGPQINPSVCMMRVCVVNPPQRQPSPRHVALEILPEQELLDAVQDVHLDPQRHVDEVPVQQHLGWISMMGGGGGRGDRSNDRSIGRLRP